jgi:thiamine-phosphate pyrophosphorylase
MFSPHSVLQHTRLCIVMTSAACARPLPEAAKDAIAGGAQMLILREKDMPDRRLLRLADELRRVTRDYGAILFINSRIDVALACAADGVQLGQYDLPLDRARATLELANKHRLLIGALTHSVEQARAAVAFADYVAIGPIFASKSRSEEQALGKPAIRQVSETIKKPIIAIGGITPENVRGVMVSGAQAAAVCTAVLAHRDTRAATEKILQAMSA